MANLDTFMYVKELPWHHLGFEYDGDPESSKDIIQKGQMDWEVGFEQMNSESFHHIPNYNVIYRKDTDTVLGVVNRANPEIVQNSEMFTTFESLFGSQLTFETAGVINQGRQVFGTFKANTSYQIVDDKVDHYFMILNDHLKPDGKVTVVSTPVRVACTNMIMSALSASSIMTRIPITENEGYNRETAINIMNSIDRVDSLLNKKALSMLKEKVSRDYVDKLLDELFPIISSEGDESLHTKANEKIEIARETFLTECMDADNLNNYRGTKWQVYNAVVDFDQHYYRNSMKAYDLNYRMQLMPGVGNSGEGPGSTTAKFIKIMNKIAA